MQLATLVSRMPLLYVPPRLVRVYGASTRDRNNVCLIMELMEVGELVPS